MPETTLARVRDESDTGGCVDSERGRAASRDLLEELPPERTRLLDNLGRLRREVGPITPELSDALADRMNLRHGDVHEVVSFYSFLQVPVDAVRVCTGPVCDCAGSRSLLTDDAIEVPCLGHCDLAPGRPARRRRRRRRHPLDERLPARARRDPRSRRS